MAWTYAQVKAAIAALTPLPATDALIAAALNAQTQSANVDIQVSSVQKILVPTGELLAVTQASTQPLSGTSPPTGGDQVIAASWALARMLDRWMVIETSQSAVWTACQAVLGGLQSAGILSSGSVAAISALRTVTLPVWQPPLTAGDVQTAKAQP